MRVIEKDTDRTAYANAHVKGQIKALEEYGQYVDTIDGAICCYVPVEEGDKIRLDGRFTGTTLTVAYDAVVDGTYRKANSYAGKSVQLQKHKKLEFESFLYQTEDGIIDTDVIVSPCADSMVVDKTTPETIGSVELRVYVTRQLGVEHQINESRVFDQVDKEPATNPRGATYKVVRPQFHMDFEKNCTTLDVAKGNRERKKLLAGRPGDKSWAIFRFHYRSRESILAREMTLSFDPTEKNSSKQDPHILELESVPDLQPGSKPASKNDGDDSVRTSSPVPPETPCTPSKGPKKAQSHQVRERIDSPKPATKKRSTQFKTISTVRTSTPDIGPPISTDRSCVVASPGNSPTDAPIPIDVSSTMARPEDPPLIAATKMIKKIKNIKTPSNASPKMKGLEADLSAASSAVATKKAPKKASTSAEVDADVADKALTSKLVDKVNETMQPEVIDSTSGVEAMKEPDEPVVSKSGADLADFVDPKSILVIAGDQMANNSSYKESIKNGTQRFISPFKKSAGKPAALNTTTTALQQPNAPLTPTTSTKRALEGNLTPPPDVKRTKIEFAAASLPTQSASSQSVSPSPRSLSIEAQVAEQRRQLQIMRSKRAKIAERKADIEERMAPHRQRMAEELEKLRQEMAEEQMMMAEEEQECTASEAMLAELEGAAAGF